MTLLTDVYDAFLASINDDEWIFWDEEDTKRDFRMILNAAMPRFKFPKHDLSIEDEHFVEDLSNAEIQILACYMKCEWLNRNIMTWENIKPLYDERDWSQANLLDKFRQTLALEQKNAKELEAVYYRSRDKKPFKFGKLAG